MCRFPWMDHENVYGIVCFLLISVVHPLKPPWAMLPAPVNIGMSREGDWRFVKRQKHMGKHLGSSPCAHVHTHTHTHTHTHIYTHSGHLGIVGFLFSMINQWSALEVPFNQERECMLKAGKFLAAMRKATFTMLTAHAH